MKRDSRQSTITIQDSAIWKRLTRNVSISVLGSGFAVAIKLGQTVLLTRFLEIDDYGRLLIVLNVFSFLDSFFGLRVSDVMFRFFQPLREQENESALKGLLLFCLAICLASGVFIYLAVLILSPWLVGRFYGNPALSVLFYIYGFTLLVSAFSGVYEPILRMYDRFSAVVVPQLLGGAATLALLLVYFTTTTQPTYDLRIVVTAFAIGGLIQGLLPLVKALRLVRPLLAGFETRANMRALSSYRRELTHCLFNSNLSGYLKFAVSPGDVFLLGLFSSPTQVALYGLAKQLTSPLAFLQTTIQTAITPEITTLVASRRLQQLTGFIRRYVAWALALGGLLLAGTLLAGRFLILHLFTAQYLQALPIFYCLVIAAWLLLVFVVFRPLALTLDLLRWHNLALLISAVVVVCLIVVGSLDAQSMAYVQLGEAGILRLAFSLLVWKRLGDRRLTETLPVRVVE